MTKRKALKLRGVRRVPLGTVAATDRIVLFPAGATTVHEITSMRRSADGRVRIEFGDSAHPHHIDAPAPLLVSIVRGTCWWGR